MPEESFSILEDTLDGKPLIAMINMALRLSDTQRLPFFLSIGTRLSNPTINGLPSAAESDELNRWEEGVESRLRGQGECAFVGRVTWNAQRELLYYVGNDKPFTAVLKALADEPSTRPFGFSCEEDGAWQRVAMWLNRI